MATYSRWQRSAPRTSVVPPASSNSVPSGPLLVTVAVGTRNEAGVVEVAQRRRRPARPLHRAVRTAPSGRARCRPGHMRDRGLPGTVGTARNRIAVRAGGRVTQDLHQPGHDLVGHDMLPAARLVVHQVPGQPDDVDEQALGEPVLAQHRLRHALALLGKGDRPSRTLDIAVRGQPVEHFGDRRGRSPEPLRDARPEWPAFPLR